MDLRARARRRLLPLYHHAVRRWMRQGACRGCGEWALCQGNDLHLWDPDRGETRLCHFRAWDLAGWRS